MADIVENDGGYSCYALTKSSLQIMIVFYTAIRGIQRSQCYCSLAPRSPAIWQQFAIHPRGDSNSRSTYICQDTLRYPPSWRQQLALDIHLPGHTTTAPCPTLPSCEDWHSVSMTILVFATHRVQYTTERAAPTPTPHVDALPHADALPCANAEKPWIETSLPRQDLRFPGVHSTSK